MYYSFLIGLSPIWCTIKETNEAQKQALVLAEFFLLSIPSLIQGDPLKYGHTVGTWSWQVNKCLSMGDERFHSFGELWRQHRGEGAGAIAHHIPELSDQLFQGSCPSAFSKFSP